MRISDWSSDVCSSDLVGTEVAHRGCTELHVVSGMHERKRMFTDLSDGFLTIPGGVGTMDELWEAISWAQLGYHAKRSEEHTSELQSLMRISYAVFCLKKKNTSIYGHTTYNTIQRYKSKIA